ncbi:MAG: hypothetical protein OEY00_11100 [Gammaproteobacteria bacterium]|nr:hypothetical protein [Gammaproteobacteria bacterium]
MKNFLLIPGFMMYLLSGNCLANNADFDVVCSYFQSLDTHKGQKAMDHMQRNNFIFEKLKSLPETSNAKAAWEAVSNAEANQRYELFKSATESVINKTWDCPAMKKLAPVTGEFK